VILPAAMSLLGRANWWPSRLAAQSHRDRRVPVRISVSDEPAGVGTVSN
jgi:uncharacterized membrane protein YdfJ with MMPL/SSD domain